MTKRSKEIRKLKTSTIMKEAKQVDYDKDGRAQIMVGLPEADSFFSPYSYLTYEFMNPGVVEYINMCESSIPVNDELSLEIYTEENTTNKEKKRIKTAVKRHNAEQIVFLKKKLKRKTTLGLMWLFAGLGILFLEIFLHLSASLSALGLVIDVAGWVLAWDGLEILTSERSAVKRKLVRSYRLMNARVHVKKYSRKIQKEYGIGEFEEEEDED